MFISVRYYIVFGKLSWFIFLFVGDFLELREVWGFGWMRIWDKEEYVRVL